MKKKKWLVPLIITLIIVLAIGESVYLFLSDKNKLTSEERTWINNNLNVVQNINVTKDETLFTKDGSGVFFSFLNDFKEQYGLKINIISKDNDESNNLLVTNKLEDNKDLFYKDHYVLISNKLEILKDNSDLENKTIGVLKSDKEYVSEYLKNEKINFKEYDDIDSLINDAKTNGNYFIIPRMAYLDKILSNNLEIIYHLDDISRYYILNVNDDILGRILHKYFMKWQDKIDENIKREEFKIFKTSLNISDTEIDKLLSIDYKYGFINNSPYEVIMSGEYGGIIAEYLKEFSEFSGVYFDITKYKNNVKLINAINKKKVDLYFAYGNDIETNFKSTDNGIINSLSIITKKYNTKMFNSIYGLINEEVYVKENSYLHDYLKSVGSIKLKPYKNIKEIKNEDAIIVMDSYIFNYYSDSLLKDYVSKYDMLIDKKYSFKISENNEILLKLMDRYINYLDNFEIISKGLNSHSKTISKGRILNDIAKYIILGIIGFLVVGFIVYKNSKKIIVAKRIKKDDKIRFIDDLTCLKNRAYLSDFIKTWNNNTIYPQAIVVVDLNKLQEINDKYGVIEGDKQIKALANALIKTQLDNSDLMRSDGNEFVIYTVGYSQKQIVNYIHKLSKEVRKLPYNFGAEFGYSMIENNLKTVEDALNEATIDMKAKKENGKN